MPRDYKHTAAHRKQRKPVSPWFSLVAGLLIGLFVAVLVYIRMVAPKHPDAAHAVPEAPDRVTEADTQPAPAPVEEKAVPPKPRFEFYAILPEMEVIVPDEEIEASTGAAPPRVEKPAPVTEKSTRNPAPPQETYYLQAGSFRGPVQADSFKAKLAMLGFETDIQTITINGKDTFHRVRVGPFHDITTLQQARSRLGKQGIETRIVRIKG